MKTELWDIGKLTPYAGNPRNNDNAVDAVAKSIEAFGFRQPIVVDRDGVIVVGHTRLKAAIQLGMKQVPVHVAADLTPEKARQYRIADNSTNELAAWDYDALSLEISEIGEINIEGFGISSKEISSAIGISESVQGGNYFPDSAYFEDNKQKESNQKRCKTCGQIIKR